MDTVFAQSPWRKFLAWFHWCESKAEEDIQEYDDVHDVQYHDGDVHDVQYHDGDAQEQEIDKWLEEMSKETTV
jgi:hypothetical protein